MIGGNHARLGAELDGHVAHRHPPFHGESFDGLTGELHHIAGTAGVADLANDGEHHVLGADPLGQLAAYADAHGLGAPLLQGLGGHHVLDLGGADAKCQRSEGAVGGGVGVAADDGGAGQGDAELGAHHVDDTLVLVVQVIEANPELLAVGGQGLHLDAGHLAGGGDVLGGGGDVVIHGGPGQIRAAQLAVHGAQAVEGLRAGHFMHQVAVDVDEGRFAFHFPHHVGVEYFLIEGLGHCSVSLLSIPWRQMRAAIWSPMAAVLCTGWRALAWCRSAVK